jgi:hypothetical protein
VLRTPREHTILPGSSGRNPRQCWGLPGISQHSWAAMGTLGDGPGLPWIAQASLAAQDCRAALGTPEDLPGLPSGAADSKTVPRAPWQLRTLGL